MSKWINQQIKAEIDKSIINKYMNNEEKNSSRISLYFSIFQVLICAWSNF